MKRLQSLRTAFVGLLINHWFAFSSSRVKLVAGYAIDHAVRSPSQMPIQPPSDVQEMESTLRVTFFLCAEVFFSGAEVLVLSLVFITASASASASACVNSVNFAN
jgi:hypothetical protein